MIMIETERLILRQPILQDYEPGAAFLASDRTKYMGGKRNAQEAWRSLAAMAGHWALRGYGFFSFALKGETAACGLAGPQQLGFYSEIEIGYSLWRADLEGTGIAFEAVKAARQWAWANVPYAPGFVSYIDPENTRSIALAKRLGATLDTSVDHPYADEPCVTYRHPQPEGAE